VLQRVALRPVAISKTSFRPTCKGRLDDPSGVRGEDQASRIIWLDCFRFGDDDGYFLRQMGKRMELETTLSARAVMPSGDLKL